MVSNKPKTVGLACDASSPRRHLRKVTGHRSGLQRYCGFTLVELLVVLAIVGLLAAMLFPVFAQGKAAARRIQCVNHLRQLGIATALYLEDHQDRFFKYRNGRNEIGDLYWFGSLASGGEGDRLFRASDGALFPYLQGRGVEMCPSLDYASSQFKLKAQGVAYGYGYNLRLSGKPSEEPLTLSQVSQTSRIAIFADCAQVNTFQFPASPDNPMLEEFYYFNEKERTTHFRHRGRANLVFVDGHVSSQQPQSNSLDERLPEEVIGYLPKDYVVP